MPAQGKAVILAITAPQVLLQEMPAEHDAQVREPGGAPYLVDLRGTSHQGGFDSEPR